MTTPAASYYEDIIRQNPSYILRYRQHQWHRFYRAQSIRSFLWEHSDEIFTYTQGCLTLQKAPVHPSWQVPEAYYKPVILTLTEKQEAAIRDILAAIPFSRMKTSACSFVNLMEDGMITEDFLCSFPMGFSFRFAGQSDCEDLEPLLKILKQIAQTAPDYQEICRMEAWLFTEQRWEQLQK